MKNPETVREILFWSYANLAMAHSALVEKQDNYKRINYIIRSRLFKGLMTDTMNIHTLFDDEKVKLEAGKCCSYCGAEGKMALDHLIPRFSGGQDTGDNLIYACKSCNSSKGKLDLMAWMTKQDKFPPLMVLRRYLKLVVNYCLKEDLMDLSLSEIDEKDLPFSIDHIPLKYPKPTELILVHGAEL